MGLSRHQKWMSRPIHGNFDGANEVLSHGMWKKMDPITDGDDW
jgi:hypothetical protein